ncbi:uncharacterized protein [Lepeophtheirus salmonis]|uniref:uncharacterized protein isoform X2 n=1 Tax=Lepeophtheirus salmonis TaxID=72036 RepID=UPI001AE7CA61|nr:uncharacterized protein LOC121119513 isoform X2 [Lepeophtheirus salmonis]
MDRRRRGSNSGCGELTIFFILNLLLFVICLIIISVMIWLRIDWGFQEWIHEMAFTNFWNGAYVLFTGTIFALINCGLGGFGIFQGWSIFLSFVYCCGADNYKDYPEIFHISPPQECINYKFAGALYYEEGCSTALSRWLKEWTSGLVTASSVMITIEILLIWRISIILRSKKHKSNNYNIDEFYTPEPPRRTTSLNRLNKLSHDSRIILRPKRSERSPLVHSTSLLNESSPFYDIPQTKEQNQTNQITRAKSESFIATNHPPLPRRIARSRSKTQDLITYIIQPRNKKRSRDFSHLNINNSSSQSKSNLVKHNFMDRRTKQESILKWNFVLPKRPIQKKSLRIGNTDCNSSLLSHHPSFETSI